MSEPTTSASLKTRLRKLETLKEEVVFADEDGDFSLYVRKLTPAEERDAAQESLRFKANLLAIQRADEHDPVRQGFSDLLEELGLNTDERLRMYICEEDVLKARLAVESRISLEPRWADNDYLTALEEAWEDGLKFTWIDNPEDEEAKRIYEALSKFREEVDETLENEIEDIYRAKEDWPYSKLLKKATEAFLLRHANNLQQEEQAAWRVYFSAYLDEECTERVFSSRQEVDEHPVTAKRLYEAYEEISISALEGKD